MCVLSACGNDTAQNTAPLQQSDSQTTEEKDNSDNNNINTSENESAINDDSANDNLDNLSNTENSSKVLIAYFSVTRTTKGVAENIAGTLSADLYEIIPSEPYVDDDLDYNNSNSRTSIEMNDKLSRPEIANNVENIEDYDIIFLGYPIWWGEAPHIIYTFMKSYDFSGKTIIPFCTSASSGIGASAENIHSVVSDNAIWLEGDKLSGNSSREDITNWINDLGLDVKAQ